MAYLGDFATGKSVYAIFNTIKACGVPVTLASAAARTIKNGLATSLLSTGVTLSVDQGSITGLHKVVVLTSNAVYSSGHYDIILSTGSVNGINIRGYLIGSFSIKGRRTGTTATAVWDVAARTLTSGATVASSVWANATRTLTSGSIMWSAATRTTTSGGAASTSVWAAGARTLTSGANVASSVWNNTTRTLSATGVDNIWDETAAEVAAVPGATPAMRTAQQWLYQASRNKRITTATADKIHTSATAVAGTAVVSFVTGPGAQTFTKEKYS